MVSHSMAGHGMAGHSVAWHGGACQVAEVQAAALLGAFDLRVWVLHLRGMACGLGGMGPWVHGSMGPWVWVLHLRGIGGMAQRHGMAGRGHNDMPMHEDDESGIRPHENVLTLGCIALAARMHVHRCAQMCIDMYAHTAICT